MNKCRILFLPEQKTVEVESGSQSILEIALDAGISIDHACGGVCACSTCHIFVSKGLDACSASSSEEEDRLDLAPGLTPFSRLACQCIPQGDADIVVEIPGWNRNLVREDT